MTTPGPDGPATTATRPAPSIFDSRFRAPPLLMKLRVPVLTLAFAALATAIHLTPGAAALLEFDRVAIARGELWRFVSAHLVHFDANHLAWDVAVFLVLGSVCERASRERTAVALAFASVAITAVLWRFQPQFEIYRGLSGLDCALFGLFAGRLLKHSERPAKLIGVLGLAGAGAKTILELATGSTVFASGVGYAPVPLAHLVGLIAGLVAALAFSRVPIFRRQTAVSPCR